MDGEPFTNQQLKAGYWYVTHKLLLKRILITFLFFTNFLVWGYILYSLTINFGAQYAANRQMVFDVAVDRFVNIAGIHQLISPQDLTMVAIQRFPSPDNRIDIIALIRNPNTKWGATFSYNFETAQGTLPTRRGFILPGEERYLMDLDVEASQPQSIRIYDIEWIRENNYPELREVRDLFQVSEPIFERKGSNDGINANRAFFTLTNTSNFNYREPEVQVMLMSGGSIVAVQTITIDRLLSGQSRQIDVRWFEDLPNVQDIRVSVELNFLDESVYIPF